MSDQTNRKEVFEQYFNHRAAKMGAATPGQFRDVAQALRVEARREGRVPIGPTSAARLNIDDPALQAVLKGETVSTGGQTIKTGRSLSSLSDAQKLAILGGSLAVLLVLLLLFIFLPIGASAAEPTPTPEATATAEPMSTLPPTIAVVPTDPPPDTPVPEPTATATPFIVPLAPANAASGANDPASIEFGNGYAYTLSQGQVRDGVWQPVNGGAEWLDQTYLRRVIALPSTVETQNIMATIRAGDIIRLRLRSGEIVDYHVITASRVKQYQIEMLSGREPSLVVALYGELSTERWLVIATHNEEAFGDVSAFGPSAFATYVPGNLTPVAPNTLPGQPVLLTGQTVSVSGLQLTVSQCRRVSAITGQPPPPQGEQYVVCTAQAQALLDGVSYNGSGMAITEQSKLAGQPDFWPSPIPVTGQLGDGVLNKAGEAVIGQVAGTIPVGSSSPVLTWQYGGVKYVIAISVGQ